MFKIRTVPSSCLFDNRTFDKAFLDDVLKCKQSIVIESPFIRLNRIYEMMPELSRLCRNGVTVIINTRPPEEHDNEYKRQAEKAVAVLQEIGVQVLFTVKHHRKLAAIDRITYWEGSLNILSYYDSCEIMRRTVSANGADTLLRFIGMDKYLMEMN